MATILPPISPLQSPTPFPRASPTPKPHAPPKFSTRATTDPDSPEPSAAEDDAFEARLSRVRYRSGTGKKAELRKTRKSKSSTSASASPSGSAMYLPPVPLKEAVSSLGGAKVELGFSPYSERVNGLAAALGLAGLLSVELATGKSLLSFHSPAVVLVQAYFMAAVTAIFVKYEKERVSVWPDDQSPATTTQQQTLKD